MNALFNGFFLMFFPEDEGCVARKDRGKSFVRAFVEKDWAATARLSSISALLRSAELVVATQLPRPLRATNATVASWTREWGLCAKLESTPEAELLREPWGMGSEDLVYIYRR